MNSLNHPASSFFGSDEDFEKLKNSESSTILVVSDSHGNVSMLQRIFLKHGKACDGFCFCGDGLSDLTECFSMASADSELKKAIPPCIVAVSGNCDFGSQSFFTNLRKDSQQEDASFSEAALLTASGFKIFVTHGRSHDNFSSINYLSDIAEANSAEIVLFGHSHIPEYTQRENRVFVNPGSITFPRGKQPTPQFGILKLTKGKIPQFGPLVTVGL